MLMSVGEAGGGALAGLASGCHLAAVAGPSFAGLDAEVLWLWLVAVLMPAVVGALLLLRWMKCQPPPAFGGYPREYVVKVFAWRCLAVAAIPASVAAASVATAGASRPVASAALLAAVGVWSLVSYTWHPSAVGEFNSLMDRLRIAEAAVGQRAVRGGAQAPRAGQSTMAGPPPASTACPGRRGEKADERSSSVNSQNGNGPRPGTALFALATAIFCVAYTGIGLCLAVARTPGASNPFADADSIVIIPILASMAGLMYVCSPLAAARQTGQKLATFKEISRRLDAVEAALAEEHAGGHGEASPKAGDTEGRGEGTAGEAP
jgi:hypothetical protein